MEEAGEQSWIDSDQEEGVYEEKEQEQEQGQEQQQGDC